MAFLVNQVDFIRIFFYGNEWESDSMWEILAHLFTEVKGVVAARASDFVSFFWYGEARAKIRSCLPSIS